MLQMILSYDGITGDLEVLALESKGGIHIGRGIVCVKLWSARGDGRAIPLGL